MLSLLGFSALMAAVYKLFQIATTLNEIKDVLQGQRREQAIAPIPAVAKPVARSVAPDDEASEYAKNLLRAVNAAAEDAPAEPKRN